MSDFHEMGLGPEVLRAIAEMGFVQPTPIQEEIIPLLLEDEGDLIGLAQTGTGKTAAFGLPLAQMADPRDRAVQALILCPTRELCVQITGDMEKFTAHLPGIRTLAVYGGANIQTQISGLRKGATFVAGTPGRVLDLISRNILDVSDIRWLVLDEADEMLNMGFKEELDAILDTTPRDKQTLLFSATMPPEMQSITRKYMRSPREIAVGKKNTGTVNVNHVYYMVHAKDRYEALKRIADMHPTIYGLVFCRTRIETKEVADKLMRDGYNADALHGDLSQAQRDHVMARFRTGNIQLLVATDVAARGLDVNDLTHVINYNLPDDADVYLHRSGRTGRAGKLGTSIAIIHTRELSRIKLIEKKVGRAFEQKRVPSGR
ncbi:MAG TPA: DEAD/DEAH box helicase, partial [Bacteroidales bacterium]|nr:DEAD/DEAH box helicase [Bacteroidales bacterium]